MTRTTLQDAGFTATDGQGGNAPRRSRRAPLGGGAEERRCRLRGHERGPARERRGRALTSSAASSSVTGARYATGNGARLAGPPRALSPARRRRRGNARSVPTPGVRACRPRNRSAGHTPGRPPAEREAAPAPSPQQPAAASPDPRTRKRRPEGASERPAPPRGSGPAPPRQGDSRGARLGPEDATGLRPGSAAGPGGGGRAPRRTPPRRGSGPCRYLPAALPPGRALGAPKPACAAHAAWHAHRAAGPSCQGWRAPRGPALRAAPGTAPGRALCGSCSSSWPPAGGGRDAAPACRGASRRRAPTLV